MKNRIKAVLRRIDSDGNVTTMDRKCGYECLREGGGGVEEERGKCGGRGGMWRGGMWRGGIWA